MKLEEKPPMPGEMLPAPTHELALKRRELAPGISAAFHTLSQKVFAAGALSVKTKQMIAVAVAHVTQCPYCITGHTKAALRAGASEAELMEAIWVAAELREGGSYAHSLLAINEMEHAAAGGEQGGTNPTGEKDVAYAAGPGRT
jgi:AhpD family alkylhydroperoxidase